MADTNLAVRISTRRELVVIDGVKNNPDILKPPMYKVIFVNDDYTPMPFVVFVLESIFNKSSDVAYAIMMAVHTQGEAVAGTYTRDIAETKAEQVMGLARQEEHPLQLTLKPA